MMSVPRVVVLAMVAGFWSASLVERDGIMNLIDSLRHLVGIQTLSGQRGAPEPGHHCQDSYAGH